MQHRRDEEDSATTIDFSSLIGQPSPPKRMCSLLQPLLLLAFYWSLGSINQVNSAPRIESSFSEVIAFRRLPDETNEISHIESRSRGSAESQAVKHIVLNREEAPTARSGKKIEDTRRAASKWLAELISGDETTTPSSRKNSSEQQQSAIGDGSLADSMATDHGEWDQFEILDQPTVEGK